MRCLLLGLPFLCTVCLAACGGNSDRICVPDEREPCACPGAPDGIQICLEDGSGWGSCKCSCEPECAGRECGDDGCGGVCPPGCQADESCVEDQCESTCVPDCSATACGPDPLCGSDCGDCDQTIIVNGDFEMRVPAGSRRPPYWYLGFREEPLPAGAGTWSVDSDEKFEGEQSLKLEPTGYLMVSQILHLPSALLEGRTVTLRLRIRHQGLDAPPTFILAAFNPEIVEEHPILGPGMAGAFVAQADAAQGEWREYVGSFTATAPATAAVVMVSATSAAGAAWVDDVRIEADTWDPGPGPDPAQVDIPIATRTFEMGFTHNSPMDYSELGYEDLLERNVASGEVLNLFFHVRWCAHALSSTPCDQDPVHLLGIELADQARALGLKLALTLDFTHNSLAGIGDLNPMPDGSPVGTLLDEDVRTAYLDELLWLVGQIDPEYVIIGIEVNIMYENHSDWWSDYVTMEARAYDAVKQRDETTHVTAYFTLDWMVDQSGALDQTHAEVWRQLQPKIDSIAWSTYPNVSLEGIAPGSYPAGYFSRPSEVSPELPVLLAEFGMAGGSDSGFTEAEQADVLRQMLTEVAAVDPVALIWYSAYDQTYLGQTPWFKTAFQLQGLHRWDGAAKEAAIIWNKVHDLQMTDR